MKADVPGETIGGALHVQPEGPSVLCFHVPCVGYGDVRGITTYQVLCPQDAYRILGL